MYAKVAELAERARLRCVWFYLGGVQIPSFALKTRTHCVLVFFCAEERIWAAFHAVGCLRVRGFWKVRNVYRGNRGIVRQMIDILHESC